LAHAGASCASMTVHGGGKRRILFPEPSWPSTSRSISRDASLPERNLPISSGDIAGIILVLTDRNHFNR
jgi:hypothetical protein